MYSTTGDVFHDKGSSPNKKQSFKDVLQNRCSLLAKDSSTGLH